jgi:hypothetical protein
MSMDSGRATVEAIREECKKVNRDYTILAGPDSISDEITFRRPLFRKILEAALISFGPDSLEVAIARYHLALSSSRTGEFEQAEFLLRACLITYETLDLGGSEDHVWCLNMLIDVGLDSENFGLVEQVFDEYAVKTKRWPASSFSAKYFFWFRFYEYLASIEEFDRAADAYSRVYESAAEVWGEGSEQHFVALAVYAGLLDHVEQPERARAIAQEAYEIGRKSKEVDKYFLKTLKRQFRL